MKARFILLDRDGVINRKVRNGYVATWNGFLFIPGALEALRLLTQAGYLPVVVSNQAGVGKGQITLSALNQITARFVRKVKACGGRIHKVYYCPHRKEAGCPCRKPRPGLLLKAQQENHFEFASTYFIGDSVSDMLAAEGAGCPAILVSGNPASLVNGWFSRPKAIVPDLRSAVDFILSRG
ncbi:MAG: D-glycero-alpha-D-manno-heptose-1,7-bisphosphate 7-phosphatase [Terriglobia bacterium]